MKKRIIRTIKFFNVETCKKNPRSLFIFGDNLLRFGKKGQAIIRSEPNAIGIVTKKYPSFEQKSYYNDNDFEDFKKQIVNDICDIINEYNDERLHYKEIIFPEDGIGTGLANLKNKAPKCFEFLNKILLENFNFNNKLKIK